MLAALLQNNNNAQPLRTSFKVDPRASAGHSRLDINDPPAQPPQSAQQFFDIADIVAAAAVFPEVASEDPITRMARRVRWISEALPFIKDAREKREAAVFLAGAHLADAAAEERHAAQTQLKIEQIVEIIDAVRRETAPVIPAVASPQPCGSHERGHSRGGGNTLGIFVGGLLVGGLLVGHALRKRTPQRRR
jgi:hypothetical protein